MNVADPLRTFLARVTRLSGTARYDAFFNEAIETGGTFVRRGCVSVIGLHGLRAAGATDEDAIETWVYLASSLVGEAA